MAHIGQEFALGAARGLRLFFGRGQSRVGGDQFRGARGNFLLQPVAMAQQLPIPVLNVG